MGMQDTTTVGNIAVKQGQDLVEIVATKFPTTICLIAIIVGVMIIFIGYRYSGGLYNKKELSFSIFISSIVGILTAPLLLKCAIWLGLQDSKAVLGLIFIIEIVFVAAVSCHTYEMVTVTAREAQARLPQS